MPGIQVHRLQLNRHLRETRGEDHCHPYHQVLVYLSGAGHQRLGEQWHEVKAGSVLWIEANTVHHFERNKSRDPLCLVMDFTLDESSYGIPHPCFLLHHSQFSEIKARLSALFLKTHNTSEPWKSVKAASVMLDLLQFLAFIILQKPKDGMGKLQQSLTNLLLKPENALLNLQQISKLTGYQQDHLNRLLKAECGLTLGNLRSKLRLQSAQDGILKGLPMQKVAEGLGILDPNYFSRWFKQQTGMTPSIWRRKRVQENVI